MARPAPRGDPRARPADRRSAPSPDRSAGERALSAARPAGRHRQRAQRRRDRLSRMAVDVSRRRAGRDAPGRRDRVRQRRRGDERQRTVRQAARLRRHRRPCRPDARGAGRGGAGGDDRGGRRPVPRHPLHLGLAPGPGAMGLHGHPAGGPAARPKRARGLRAAGAARPQLRRLDVPSRSSATWSTWRAPFRRRRSCSTMSAARSASAATRASATRSSPTGARHPRAGALPQRACEARRARHADVRLRRA